MTDTKEGREESYQCIVTRLGAVDLKIIIIIILRFFSSPDQYFFDLYSLSEHVTHKFRTHACPFTSQKLCLLWNAY